MSKLKQILEGWSNLVLNELDLLSEDIKLEGERRADICEGCPLRVHNTCDPNRKLPAVKDFRYYTEDRFKGVLYSGCGCKIHAKVLSPESKCPCGKWEKE